MKKAVVSFSGGQDSTVCLGAAIADGYEVHAITFAYGQKHAVEISSAVEICAHFGIPHKILNLGALFDGQALTSPTGDFTKPHDLYPDLPASFVPNRNGILLSLAHAYAQKIGAWAVYTGANQTDYSGYPDCRKPYLTALESLLNLGSGAEIAILTPLIDRTKAETFAMAYEFGMLAEVVQLTHTCYNGDHRTYHAWGYGCGECPSCKLRAAGWESFANSYLNDPVAWESVVESATAPLTEV